MRVRALLTACFLCSIAALSVQTVFAQGELLLKAQIIDASEPIRTALQENKGYSSTTLHGKGGVLHLQYSASEDITVFLVPVDAKNNYVPNDTLLTILPKGSTQNVALDLTVSPGWSPWQEAYLLQMLTPSKEAEASFFDVQFENASLTTTLVAALKHLAVLEPYSPSTYHALRGYRVLGTSFTMIAGVLLLILSCAIFGFYRKLLTSLLPAALLVCTLLIASRSTIDGVRFTLQHLSEYYEHGTYDEAGSIFDVATFLRSKNIGGQIYICRDGTNFQEKLLRYSVYPLPVGEGKEHALGATHVLVTDKRTWVFDEKSSRLTCGDIAGMKATQEQTFFDGSILFSLHQS